MLSFSEENYLKALLHITQSNYMEEVGTSELAVVLQVKPATVNSMLKKLRDKNLVEYQKYGKIKLTQSGHENAMAVIRKHRLWETFLYKKLDFTWDEVHEVAEQLEHIQSDKLIDKLDQFLNFPEFDPHGDPIPNKIGAVKIQYQNTLADMEVGKVCKMVAVKNDSPSFLHYVDELGLGINRHINILSKHPYDAIFTLEINDQKTIVSQRFAENIIVICDNCAQNKPCAENTICEIKK